MTGTEKEYVYTVKVRFDNDEKKHPYAYATIKVDASKDKTEEISKKTDYKKYEPKVEEPEEPKETFCETCGVKLVDGKKHTDSDHKTCPDCNAVYHVNAEHKCETTED